MKNGIVKSESSLKRNPKLAFILSFFFTGLGQIYNGDFAKGIVFFILRILTLLLIPLYLTYQNRDSCLDFVLFSIMFNKLIWLIAPIEAIIGARKEHAINLKKYNSLFFYGLFGVFNAAVLAFSVFIVSFFFTIEKVSTDLMSPTLLEDEYVLLVKAVTKKLDIGDVVTYTSEDQKRLGRIIAKEGEAVSIKGNVYYINETALKLSILSDIQLEQMGLENAENLFYETNGSRKYPVKVTLPDSSSVSKKKTSALVNSKMLFISYDNRASEISNEIINSDIVKGRVEGILFSSKINRLFSKPYLID